VASTTPRRHPRVVPGSPLTVAIEDESGLCLGYGVIANLSRAGACIWTNGALPPGAHLSFRLSFCNPAEVHEVDGLVVWGGTGESHPEASILRFGVEWQETPAACAHRLSDLVRDAEEETLTPRSLAALRQASAEH
jgi:hypothetical protein